MMKLGKKDSEARTALNEALETSRKLTEKRQVAQSDEEEEEDGEDQEKNDVDESSALTNGAAISGIANNPWLSSGAKKTNEETKEIVEEETISSMYPKLEEIRNEQEDESSDEEDDGDEDDEEKDDDDDEMDDKEKLDAEDLPTIQDEDDEDETAVSKAEKIIEKVDAAKENATATSSSKAQEVDPNKFLLQAPETVSSGQLPTLASYENEIDGAADDDNNEIDDEESRRRLTIEEAFADDDVVAEFAAAKSSVVDRQTPKAVCTALPGWGEWVGGQLSGISAKRKRKFTEKPQKTIRKDKDKPRVIINEKQRGNKLARHLVSDIPTRDFDSVAEFEKSIRAPVGRMWNAEAAYQKLIVPGVTTKMGTVIDPINKEKTFVRKEEEAYSGDEEVEDKEARKGGKKRKRDGNKKDKGPMKKADRMNHTSAKKKLKTA